MPELCMFWRRWHVATDTSPIVASILAAIHMVYIIPILTGTYSIESTGIRFNCNVSTAVRLAVYGMFAVLLVSAIVEICIVSIGLKGGPLEEYKRAHIVPLLYAEVFLWVLALAWTVYGTYMVVSPVVAAQCWDNNPCAYSNRFPAACTGVPDSGGANTLSPPCQTLLDNSQQWGGCFEEWFLLGTSYVLHDEFGDDSVSAGGWNCSATTPAADNIDGWVANAFFDGNLSRYLDRADQLLDGSVDDAGFNLDLLIEGGTLAAVRAYNQQLRSLGYLTRNIELAFLNLSGLPYDLERVGQGAPWAGCQNESCAWLISASDACEQWDLLLALPVPRDNKRYFMILVWTGWGLLAFKVFLVALAFNSFPDYEDVESWEGGLRVFSRLCCFGNVLHEEVMEERHVPSRVIAQSLSMLFGSIDLDPTDRLFAALLLAEQQRDQRQINMRLMLDRAGFKMRPAKGGAFFKGRRAWNSGELYPEQSHGVRGQGMHAFQPWLGAVEEGRYPVYCRTGLHYDGTGLGEENGGWAASPEGLNASRPPWTPCLRVTHQYMPMLTPAEVPAEYLSHINPVEVAAVCSGPQRPVMASALQDMHRMATFAVAAYGVQNQAWNGGRRPVRCSGCINTLKSLYSRIVGGRHGPRQRNCDAILDLTGCRPTDLLYVSYANMPAGALPYLVMWDRSHDTLVISLRGTVSLADLVTDLLSQPVDVSDWLPAWVRKEIAEDQPVYAHAGIVSAATAVLVDMEGKGLLKELLAEHQRCAILRRLSTQLGEQSLGFQSMRRRFSAASLVSGAALDPQHQHWQRVGDLEAFFTLDRLRGILRRREGASLKLALTGHSLGAAVACMLGLQLRQECPDIRCWAFCPPGGLMSWNLAQLTRRFCTSIVVGKDVISRMSFNALKRTVDEMVICLARCRRPKLIVLADFLLGRRGKSRVPPTTLCDMDDIPDFTLKILERYCKTSYFHGLEQPELYPPGDLAFLRPFKQRRRKESFWDAVWISANDLVGEGIQVSAAMLLHHRVYSLMDALESSLQHSQNLAATPAHCEARPS